MLQELGGMGTHSTSNIDPTGEGKGEALSRV